MKTREQVTADMMAAASRHDTALLCDALAQLDRRPRMTDAERMTRAVLIDTLCARHPEADAAFEAWAADESTIPPHGAVDAITEAARKAAARRASAA